MTIEMTASLGSLAYCFLLCLQYTCSVEAKYYINYHVVQARMIISRMHTRTQSAFAGSGRSAATSRTSVSAEFFKTT